MAKRVFLSYSHCDEAHRDRLVASLSLLKRQGKVQEWHDRKIIPGAEWATVIDQELQLADIVIFLVSADFIASDYCWGVEVAQAMDRRKAGDCIVVPVIARPCDWHTAPFGKLQALPTDGIPVTSWENVDTAWLDVVKGIRLLCP